MDDLTDSLERFFDNVGTSAPQRDGRRFPRTPEPADDTKPTASDTEGAAWAVNDKVYWKASKSVARIPAGVYRCEISQEIGPYLRRITNDTDKLILLPDSASASLVEEIRRFQGMKAKFDEHGFLHKRGVLMWGPPGSGKTTTLQWLIKLIVEEHQGIACFIDGPHAAVACLQMTRQIEPERQIVGILEDIDALVDRYGEAPYLALLDGESQVDNVVYVATTNYPERLDRRFVDRPSRFDTIKYIGWPTPEDRAVYFKAKMPNVENIQAFVDVSDNYSVAHMRELVILTQCFGISLEEATARLNKARTKLPNSQKSPDRGGLGFLTGTLDKT
jgi:energy-coupling factor transporter ATP-binding protein EcfA2